MSKIATKRLKLLLVVALLIGAWFTIEHFMYRRVVPPTSVTDIKSFLQWQTATTQFVIVPAPAGEHLMATGRYSSMLPSGPAAYVFDRSGRLVDWSWDIDDDGQFDQKWHARAARLAGKTISTSQVPVWLAPATNPAG